MRIDRIPFYFVVLWTFEAAQTARERREQGEVRLLLLLAWYLVQREIFDLIPGRCVFLFDLVWGIRNRMQLSLSCLCLRLFLLPGRHRMRK
jgi:hypothetical protein